MNKYYFALAASFIRFNAVAQAWVWDEIAQEAEGAEPTTFPHIIAVGLLCVIIWLGVKFFNYLKGLEKVKYLKIRKTTIILSFIITVLLPFSILNYFDLKKESLESKAKHSLNRIINNFGSYIEVDNGGYASFNEIQPWDNQKPNNQITIDWAYKLFLSQGATPYEGIYRCFNIGTSGFQVVFAGDAKRKGFSSEDAPVLFHGWIKPYRIRYYSADNIDPNRDLGNVFRGFIRSFIKEHNAQLRDDITNDFFYQSLNEYYEIRHVPSGDEMWSDNKLYYENEIVQERSYEYKTINYGNYDITYCISRPCKLGVCEKIIQGSILGTDIFGEIHWVRRNEALAKYCSIWIICLGAITAIFFFGNPSRK